MPNRVIITDNANNEQLSTSPAGNGTVAVTINTPWGFIARGLYVGTTGDVSLVLPNGNTVIFKTVPVGVLPVACTNVTTANTTASNLVALA